jgi:hypothetical protein
MKRLLVASWLMLGCSGTPRLPPGLPPPEYERPGIPGAASGGEAPVLPVQPVEPAAGGVSAGADPVSGASAGGAAALAPGGSAGKTP